MMDKTKIHLCLNLIKKLPVDDIDKNIESLSFLINKKDQVKEFRHKVDKPLRISKDDSLGNFIESEFNCELDSYRSPHSNKYFPPIDNAKYPPNELRELEIILNKLFNEYAKLYYGNTAITSVYVWEHGENIESGFYCALLIKNVVNSSKGLKHGEWDSVNLVNIKFANEKDKVTDRIKATYKIYSNVIFKFILDKINVDISGSLSRQSEESYFIKTFLDNEFHLEKIGKLVEITENSIINQMESVYFKKSTEIFDKLRSTVILGKPNANQANHLLQIFGEKLDVK